MVIAIVVVVVMIVAVVAVIIPMFVTMVFTIVGNVCPGIPVMPDEVDRLAAGVVFAAMVAPIALIAGAYVQIDGWRQWRALDAYSHDGRAIDEAGRRRITDIHAAVKSRVAQVDGNPHLCERCGAEGQRCNSRGEK
jgi:hypothetical protein